MTAESDPSSTPIGIVFVSGLLILYGVIWMITWGVALIARNEPVALLSMVIFVAVLVLAWALYVGNRVAWGTTILTVGVSTVWRLSLVPRDPSNLVNAVVGVIIVGYLVTQREYYYLD